MSGTPSILGLGVITDVLPSIHTLAVAIEKSSAASASPARNADKNRFMGLLERTLPVGLASIAQHDMLPQLALAAAHQALSMAGLITATQPRLQTDTGQETALIVVSAWGAIDATVAYLDSMLDSDGRYASPRHFSRSVYSSVASITAIHFGIHGPCETLSFPKDPVPAALHRARRLLNANRCRQVLVIWGDQQADIASDLARRASAQLKRHEFDRYVVRKLGCGAVGVLLGQGGAGFMPLRIEDDLPTPISSGPFPIDSAVALVEKIIRGFY